MFSNEKLYELADVYHQECGFVDTEQFRNDVLRFLYIHRLLKRYVNSGHVNCRLLINHIVVLHNVFSTKATEVLLEYIDSSLNPQLFALLYTFHRLPQEYWAEEIDHDLYKLLQQEIGNDVDN